MPLEVEFSLSLVVLGRGLGEEECLGMLVSENLGMLEVSTPRIFPFNLILGNGTGKIDFLGMLVLKNMGCWHSMYPDCFL